MVFTLFNLRENDQRQERPIIFSRSTILFRKEFNVSENVSE